MSRKTANDINRELLKIFASFGYPHIIIGDNMPLGSYECKQFAKKYDIQIITSSPHYPKSNGLAERAIQIAKNILKKSSNENEIYESILAYRTTPVKFMKYCPAPMLQNRIPRNDLPMHDKKLKPNLCNDVESQLKLKQEKMKQYYDRTTRQRDALQNNQNVLFVNNQKWQHGH